MGYSENFNFALPSSDNDVDLADVNEISNNFRKIDENAVIKENGKGLSTNDYTDEDKALARASLQPADKAELTENITNLENGVDELKIKTDETSEAVNELYNGSLNEADEWIFGNMAKATCEGNDCVVFKPLNNRITAAYVYPVFSKKIKVGCKNGYQCRVLFYAERIGEKISSGVRYAVINTGDDDLNVWHEGERVIQVPANAKGYTVTLARVDGAEMSVDEFSAVSVKMPSDVIDLENEIAEVKSSVSDCATKGEISTIGCIVADKETDWQNGNIFKSTTNEGYARFNSAVVVRKTTLKRIEIPVKFLSVNFTKMNTTLYYYVIFYKESGAIENGQEYEYVARTENDFIPILTSQIFSVPDGAKAFSVTVVGTTLTQLSDVIANTKIYLGYNIARSEIDELKAEIEELKTLIGEQTATTVETQSN